jgi:hypothetical protein
MNIVKSFDLNSMTLRKIEDVDREDCFLWSLCCMCKISWTNYH